MMPYATSGDIAEPDKIQQIVQPSLWECPLNRAFHMAAQRVLQLVGILRFRAAEFCDYVDALSTSCWSVHMGVSR